MTKAERELLLMLARETLMRGQRHPEDAEDVEWVREQVGKLAGLIAAVETEDGA